MAQVISHWPVIAKVWVQSQASQCEIRGGQSGTGTGFPVSIIPQVLHACSFIYHPLKYEQLTVSINTMHFSGNCLCLILIKCTCATLNYKHKLRKIPAKYWQREVTVENHVLFFSPHTLSSQVLQGTNWILGSLASRTTTRDSNATPLLRIYIKTTKKKRTEWLEIFHYHGYQ